MTVIDTRSVVYVAPQIRQFILKCSIVVILSCKQGFDSRIAHKTKRQLKQNHRLLQD